MYKDCQRTQEWTERRTTGGASSNIGADREEDNGRSSQLQRRSNMIFFSIMWACRVLLVKIVLSCVMYWEKIFFRYIGLTNCVHDQIKAGGLGCTGWGGGSKSTKIVDNDPHVMGEFIWVNVVVFGFVILR